MRKTITITDPMLVKLGDKAYFKVCGFGFRVLETDMSNPDAPLKVYDPLIGDTCWPHSHQFDHATREVEDPGWPDPHDTRLHVYLGADDVRYIYNPTDKYDPTPWFIERQVVCRSRETMEVYHRIALPLTELKLVPAKDDDDEQWS